MKKKPEVTEATREAFVDAFFHLAKRESIHQITVREIAELAGYNRTTFYRYFVDVYALIEYAEDEFLQRTRNALDKWRDEKIIDEKRFFEVLIRCFHEQTDRVLILLSEQNRSHFLRRIEENVTNNLYEQHNDTPKKRVMRDIYFYGIFYAISINLQSRETLSDEDLLDMIRKLFNNWYWPEMQESEARA